METELGKPAEAATPVNSCFGTQSVVMVIVDASDKRTREQLHLEVVKVLMSQSHIPAVLVLNKVLTLLPLCFCDLIDALL